jgi:hypothetical protein
MNKVLLVVSMVVLGFGLHAGCGSKACSPCKPGTHALVACGTCYVDVDVDGGADGDGGCAHDPTLNCVYEIERQGDLRYCGDVGVRDICVNGKAACPPGAVEFRLCTCSGPAPRCLVCGPRWNCSDGGGAGTTDASDAHDTYADADADAATSDAKTDAEALDAIKSDACPE